MSKNNNQAEILDFLEGYTYPSEITITDLVKKPQGLSIFSNAVKDTILSLGYTPTACPSMGYKLDDLYIYIISVGYPLNYSIEGTPYFLDSKNSFQEVFFIGQKYGEMSFNQTVSLNEGRESKFKIPVYVKKFRYQRKASGFINAQAFMNAAFARKAPNIAVLSYKFCSFLESASGLPLHSYDTLGVAFKKHFATLYESWMLNIKLVEKDTSVGDTTGLLPYRKVA